MAEKKQAEATSEEEKMVDGLVALVGVTVENRRYAPGKKLPPLPKKDADRLIKFKQAK